MKKKNLIKLICLPLLFLFSGCLTTLHPFFLETDVVENADLIGQWSYTESNTKGILQIEKIPAVRYNELEGDIKKIAGKGYFITWKDSTGTITAQYFAFLAKIDANYYFDYYPAETDVQKGFMEIFKQHYIKLHTCYKVTFKDNQNFEIRLFDQGFAEKLIDQRKILMKYEQQQEPDHNKIITASTEELREYLKKYGDNKNAVGDTYLCKKIFL